MKIMASLIKKIIEFLHPDNIQQYSTKINTILNYVEKLRRNSIYIYSLSFGWSLPIAIALEHLGYKRYIKGNTSSSFLKMGRKTKPKQHRIFY